MFQAISEEEGLGAWLPQPFLCLEGLYRVSWAMDHTHFVSVPPGPDSSWSSVNVECWLGELGKELIKLLYCKRTDKEVYLDRTTEHVALTLRWALGQCSHQPGHESSLTTSSCMNVAIIEFLRAFSAKQRWCCLQSWALILFHFREWWRWFQLCSLLEREECLFVGTLWDQHFSSVSKLWCPSSVWSQWAHH